MTSSDARRPKLSIQNLITVLFFIFVALFLVKFLRGIDFSKLKGLHFSLWPLLLACIIGIASRYWGVLLWLNILRGLGAKQIKDKAYLAYAFAKSWLTRYVPGPATWMFTKVYFASKLGIDKRKLAVSSLLEGGIEIVVLLGTSIIFLVFDRRLSVINTQTRLFMIGVFVACLVALTPKIFNWLVSKAYKILKHKELGGEHMVSNRVITQSAARYTVGAIFNGLSLFFIVKAIYPELSYHNMLFVMGVGNLSGALGLLAIGIPGGLGVREGVQVVLLSLIMPKEIALVAAIVTRLWTFAVDLMFFGAARAVLALKPGQHN